MYKFFALDYMDVRNNYWKFIDEVIGNKPLIVSHSDNFFMSFSIPMVKELVRNIIFSYTQYKEDDDSYTLSFNDLDIVVNALTKEEALKALVADLREYAKDYYQDLSSYYTAPNRKHHFPFIMKTLIIDSDEELLCDFKQS